MSKLYSLTKCYSLAGTKLTGEATTITTLGLITSFPSINISVSIKKLKIEANTYAGNVALITELLQKKW